MTGADDERANRLNDMLDARARQEAFDAAPLDPVAADIDRFFARDDAPGPPDELTTKIWEELMHQTSFQRSIPLIPSIDARAWSNGAAPAPPRRPPLAGPTPTPADWRRAGVPIVIAVVLLLAVGIGYRAFGPFGPEKSDGPSVVPAMLGAEATPSQSFVPRAGHPIIGVWLLDNDPSLPGQNLSHAQFSENGTYIEYHAEAGLSIGTWQVTGERSADLIFTIQRLVYRDLFDPDQTIEGSEFDPTAFLQVWRVSIEIDESGNAMTLEGDFDIFDAAGTLMESHHYEGIGQRMDVVSTTAEATPAA